MLETLDQLCNGGALRSARLALFDGHSDFITALELTFDSLVVTFRAIADDDTIRVEFGSIRPDEDEVLTSDLGNLPLTMCIGSTVSWAWQLTDHRGYDDGVRLEFRHGPTREYLVVEMIVLGSQLDFYDVSSVRKV